MGKILELNTQGNMQLTSFSDVVISKMQTDNNMSMRCIARVLVLKTFTVGNCSQHCRILNMSAMSGVDDTTRDYKHEEEESSNAN